MLGVDLQLGRVFVADRQPERAARLEHAVDFGHPLPRPVEVLVVVLAVVVLVVLVADVERRIGEHQIDRAGLDLPHQFEAIALMNLADFEGVGDGEASFGFDRHARASCELQRMGRSDEMRTSIW